MNFKDLNLKKFSIEKKSFILIDKNNNQHEINVNQFISSKDKKDLIDITLQKADKNGNYDELLLDIYFHLNLIYLYTDIDFDIEDRIDELDLYDILDQNDIINQTIANMKDGEYEELRHELLAQKEFNMKYRNSAAAVLRSFIQDLPESVAAAKEVVDGFNPDDYKNVVNFAIAANAGRPINQ